MKIYNTSQQDLVLISCSKPTGNVAQDLGIGSVCVIKTWGIDQMYPVCITIGECVFFDINCACASLASKGGRCQSRSYRRSARGRQRRLDQYMRR